MPFFGSARSRLAAAVGRQKRLYGNSMMSNARAKNAGRAAQKEATRALWSARRRRVLELLGKAGKGALSVTKKIGAGGYAGLKAGAGVAVKAAGFVAAGAKLLGGKAYGAAGAVAARAAQAAKAAADKVRSFSAGRRTKNFFMGKKKLTNTEVGIVKARGMNPNSTEARALINERRRLGGKDKLGREGGLLRKAAEKTKAAVSATRKALGAAGNFLGRGVGVIGRGLGAARNYVSRKAGNARQGLSNMYTRMRYGGHEKRLEAERARAGNAVNAAEVALKRNSDAKAKAAGKTLGVIAAKLKTANVAAANGSNAKAATALGAAVTAAKTASKKGWFSKLGNAAKNFTRGVGARLGKLRNMFKGTKKNNGPAKAASVRAMFTGSARKGNKGYGKTPAEMANRPPQSGIRVLLSPKRLSAKRSSAKTRKNGPKNAYGMPFKGVEGRSARKLLNVLAGRSEGAKPLLFGLPGPMSKSAAARRLGRAPVNLSGATAVLSAARAASRAKTPAQRAAAAEQLAAVAPAAQQLAAVLPAPSRRALQAFGQNESL